MKDSFTIEFEVEETEKAHILEKLRAYFLQIGFIVQRETNSQIDLYRPLPGKRKKEDLPLTWTDHLCISAESGTVRLVFSMKRAKIVRFIVLTVSPIIEISLGVVLYFLFKVPPIVPIVLILGGISTPVMGYFLFEYIYRSALEYYGREIQKIIG
mgnify:CR=1 FL=1